MPDEALAQGSLRGEVREGRGGNHARVSARGVEGLKRSGDTALGEVFSIFVPSKCEIQPFRTQEKLFLAPRIDGGVKGNQA